MIQNIARHIVKFIREFFYKKIEQKYIPSSRKVWATLFCSVSLVGFILKFMGWQFITTADLAILSSLATAAVGWYSFSVKNQTVSPEEDEEMYLG